MIVYLVFSPEHGPEHRIYCDDEIQAIGGIHAVERSLENESYWFVRLGQVQGEANPRGVTVRDSDIAQLPTPPEHKWRLGRRNPAFRTSDLERHIFRATFKRIEQMLDGWKKNEGRAVDAYALKTLRMSAERLSALNLSLSTLPKVHEVVDIGVIKYWYDASWPEPHLPCDLVLAEFSLKIPLQFRRSAEQKLFSVEVLNMAFC